MIPGRRYLRLLAMIGMLVMGSGTAGAQVLLQGKAEIYLDPKDRNADWHAGWADAVVAGDLVFVSGVIASLEGSETGANSEPAFERAFDRLTAVLKASGATLDDIVEITGYLTDVERDTAILNRVRLQRMRSPFAASTLVQVQRLIPPRGIAELRVIARRTGTVK